MIIAANAAIEILEKRGYGWISRAAVLLDLINLEVNTFCSTDPPSLPTFTAAEANAALSLTFGADLTSALEKLRDTVLHYAWFDFCRCDATFVPPTATTPQPMPAGTSVVIDSARRQCSGYHGGSNVVGAADGVFHGPQYNFDWTIFSDRTPAPSADPPPAVRVLFAVTHTSGIGSPYMFRYQFCSDAAGTNAIETHDYGPVASGASLLVDIPVPTAALSSRSYTSHTVATSDDPSTSVALLCDVSPNAPTPCCPPDQTMLATMALIKSQVDLIQRQAVPFAYVSGASHAGLTGEGSIAVSALIGAKIVLTALSARVSQGAGDPDHLSGAGWINWGSADGVTAREYLSAVETLSLPAAAGALTAIHYSLGIGVTATITELEREP